MVHLITYNFTNFVLLYFFRFFFLFLEKYDSFFSLFEVFFLFFSLSFFLTNFYTLFTYFFFILKWIYSFLIFGSYYHSFFFSTKFSLLTFHLPNTCVGFHFLYVCMTQTPRRFWINICRMFYVNSIDIRQLFTQKQRPVCIYYKYNNKSHSYRV